MSYVQAVMDGIKEEIEFAERKRADSSFRHWDEWDEYIAGLQKALEIVVEGRRS